MTLYDALKASKGLPVNDSYAALWGKSAESGIKTLTGRLPLYFKTLENKLRDWIIYGNNEPGKNLLEITAESQTIHGVTFTVDKQAGTISIDGTVPSSGNVDLQLLEAGEILSEPQTFVASIDSIAPDSKVYLGFRKKSQSGGVSYITVFPSSSVTITLGEGEYFDLVYIAARKGQTLDNVSVKPMIRLPDTSSDFEPYKIGVGEKTENGYVLNIGVGFAPISSADPAVALITRKTINLGESPLTEGQTLSMSDFGDIETQPYADMFIAAFEGFNYDDQLSYNQPEMRLKYKEYKE